MNEITLERKAATRVFVGVLTKSVTEPPVESGNDKNVAATNWAMGISTPVSIDEGNKPVNEEASWARRVRNNLTRWMKDNPY